jgi:DNA-binding ferritin-like protein
MTGGRVMNNKSEREQLEKKLEQVRRMAAQASDRTTTERLTELIDELEGRLRDTGKE